MSTADQDARRARRRSATAIKDSMRELSNQLSLLNHHVATHVALKGVDVDCLDLIARHGPLTPTALSRRTGIHPATMTGILDRLQRGGWIARERDSETDRRAVTVRALRDRSPELYRLYAGMNASMDEILADYDQDGLELIAAFVRRIASAGGSAAEDLAANRRGA